MISVRIVIDDETELEYLAEYIEVHDATGDDALRLRVIDAGIIKLDTAPM